MQEMTPQPMMIELERTTALANKLVACVEYRVEVGCVTNGGLCAAHNTGRADVSLQRRYRDQRIALNVAVVHMRVVQPSTCGNTWLQLDHACEGSTCE